MSDTESIKMVYEPSGWLVHTRRAALNCSVVVNASGAWAHDVAVRAGILPIEVTPLRRTVIIIDAPPDLNIADWPLVLDTDEAFYLKPYGSRLLCSLCDETASDPVDAFPTEYDIALAADRIETVTTLTVDRIRSKWAGLRTFTPDRSFAIGFDHNYRGFFWCVGQGGYGIQTAPAIAALCAGLIAKAQTPVELERLGIDRAALDPKRFFAA